MGFLFTACAEEFLANSPGKNASAECSNPPERPPSHCGPIPQGDWKSAFNRFIEQFSERSYSQPHVQNRADPLENKAYGLSRKLGEGELEMWGGWSDGDPGNYRALRFVDARADGGGFYRSHLMLSLGWGAGRQLFHCWMARKKAEEPDFCGVYFEVTPGSYEHVWEGIMDDYRNHPHLFGEWQIDSLPDNMVFRRLDSDRAEGCRSWIPKGISYPRGGRP